MKVTFLLASFIVIFSNVKAQVLKPKIYMIHGQGSDCRLFSKLKLDQAFDTVCIALPIPGPSDDMTSYAKKIALSIDTMNPFVLLGVSLGGMVASELNELLHPMQTIIISSAKNNHELPQRYKFMKKIPLYKLFPARLLKTSSFIVQPLFEPDRRREKKLFKSMLYQKDKLFLKRSIPLIIHWDKSSNKGKPIFHIHGTNDHTIPLKNIVEADIIEKGSHMMTLTEATRISEKINHVLQQLK